MIASATNDRLDVWRDLIRDNFVALDIHVPWSATLFMQGIIVIFVAVPSAPGFFGPFELGATGSLALYGVSSSDAATWALIFHVASFIPITLIGAYYSTRLGFRMGDVRSSDLAEGA